MRLKIIQYIGIILLALVMGVFWGTWFSLSRSLEAIDPSTFLINGKIFIKNLAVPMAILMPLTILFLLLSLFLIKPKKSKEFYFTLISLIFFIAALLITLLIEVPIDNQIKIWTIETLPSDWKNIRDRWEIFHTIRTFLSIISFGFAVLVPFTTKKI